MGPLLAADHEWAPETAFALVQRELVQRLPGAPRKGTADGS